MTDFPTAPSLEPPRGPAPAQAVGNRALRGFFWLLLQTLGSKLANLIGQYVLTWLLFPEHFGLVLMAYTVSSLANVLQQTGLREILVQRQAHVQRWINPAFWMALALGLATALVTIAGGEIAVPLYGQPTLRGLLVVLAIAAPMNSVAIIPMALLQNQMRFRLIAVIGSLGALLTVVLSICFASFFDFGAYSLVLPIPIVFAFRLAAFWYFARPRVWLDPQIRRWRYMVGDGAPVFLGRLGVTIISYADYIALGIFFSEAIVGIYFWAFMLSMQTVMLLAFNLEGVLSPVLSKLQLEPLRQRQGFTAAARMLAFIGVPACLLQAAVAEPVVHLFFRPVWHPGIPVIQILSIAMGVRLLATPANTLMQTQGRFLTFMWVNLVGAVLFVLLVSGAALLATPGNAAVSVALAAAVFFALEGPLSVYVAIAHAGGTWREVGGIFALPYALACFAAAVALLVEWFVVPEASNLISATVIALVMIGTYALGSRWLAADLWSALRQRFRKAPLAV